MNSEIKTWMKQMTKLQDKIVNIRSKIDDDDNTIQSILKGKKYSKKVMKSAWKQLQKHIKKYHDYSRIAFYMSVGELNWQDERKKYLKEDKYKFIHDYQNNDKINVLSIRDDYTKLVSTCLQQYSTSKRIALNDAFSDNDCYSMVNEFFEFKFEHHEL